MSSLFAQSDAKMGQEIGQFKAGSGAYGQAIPYVFGCIFVPEFRLWQQNSATPREGQSGKGTAGGGNTLYSGDYFSGFCLGPIPMFGNQVAIRRVMGDNGILADLSEQKVWLSPPETIDQMHERLAASNAFLARTTFYNGALSGQIADPQTAAALGGNIPGYQGIVCASWDNLEWPGGRPITINAEICQSATLTGANQIIRQSCALSTIITRLLVDSGITESDIDVSELLTQQVRGITIPQDEKRKALDNLMRYFDLECVQSGQVITFFPIDRPVMITIPFSDFSAQEKDQDGNAIDPLDINDIDEMDIPRKLQITAKNYDNDYVDLPGEYTDVSGRGQAVVEYDMGEFAATSTEINQAAQKQLFRLQAERYTYDFTLPPKYLNLEPCDVVNVTDDDNSVTTVRLKTVDIGGSNNLVKCSAVRHSVFTSTLAGAPTYGGISIISAGETTWVFMNIPPLRDEDAANPGAYVAACGTGNGWLYATLHKSTDAGASYGSAVSIGAPAIIGTVRAAAGIYSSALPSSSQYVIDKTSKIAITLVNPNSTLGSVTLAQALSGQNVFLIGNEIVIAITVTFISPGVYGLSNFIRGRRSTESQIDSHVNGETVVLLSGAGVSFVSCNFGDIGRTDLWKMVPNGQVLADVPAVGYAITGQTVEPFSPVNIKNTITDSGTGLNAVFTWDRRSRIGKILFPTPTIPLGETIEQYLFEILDPSNAPFKTITLYSPTWSYSQADRNTDLGSPYASMAGYKVRVTQYSSTVGYGHPSELYILTG